MPWHPEIGLYPSADEEPLSVLEWQALHYRVRHHREASGRVALSADHGLIERVRLDFLRYQHAVNLSLARDATLSLTAAEAQHLDILSPPAGHWH